MNENKLDAKMKEIELIQKQVSDIIYNKSWIKRFIYFGKAKKLHKLAQEKINNLFVK